MCAFAQKALQFIADISVDDFLLDDMRSYAVLKCVEVVGEAANYFSEHKQKKYDLIDFRAYASLRHHTVHEYIGVDFRMIHFVVVNKFPILIEDLQAVLDQEVGI